MESESPTFLRIIRVHLMEWVCVVFLGILMGISQVFPPYQRIFFITDQSIQYPLLKQTVPTWALMVFTLKPSYIESCITPHSNFRFYPSPFLSLDFYCFSVEGVEM